MALTIQNQYFDYENYHNLGLEIDGVAFNYWNHTIDWARFNTLLEMLSRGISIKSKKVQWPVGGMVPVDGTLQGNHTIPDAGNTFTLTVSGTDLAYLVPGDMLYIIDTNSSSSAYGHFVHARITSPGVIVGGNVQFSNVYVVYNSNHASTTFSDGAELSVNMDANEYDGEARDGSDMVPGIMYNVVQRSRLTFQKGKWSRTGNFIHDNSMLKLQRENARRYAYLNSMAVYFNPTIVEEIGANNYGVAGGLTYFLNPENDPNKPQGSINFNAPSALTYEMLSDYFTYFRHTSGVKWVVASPLVIQKILKLFRDSTQITNVQYGIIDEAQMWGGLTKNFLAVDLSTHQIVLIPDEVLRGKSIHVNDGVSDYVGEDFAFIIDPAFIKKAYLDVEGEGVQTPHVRPIQPINNSSVEKYEYDSTWTLIVDDPRAFGIVGNIQ